MLVEVEVRSPSNDVILIDRETVSQLCSGRFGQSGSSIAFREEQRPNR